MVPFCVRVWTLPFTNCDFGKPFNLHELLFLAYINGIIMLILSPLQSYCESVYMEAPFKTTKHNEQIRGYY